MRSRLSGQQRDKVGPLLALCPDCDGQIESVGTSAKKETWGNSKEIHRRSHSPFSLLVPLFSSRCVTVSFVSVCLFLFSLFKLWLVEQDRSVAGNLLSSTVATNNLRANVSLDWACLDKPEVSDMK